MVVWLSLNHIKEDLHIYISKYVLLQPEYKLIMCHFAKRLKPPKYDSTGYSPLITTHN